MEASCRLVLSFYFALCLRSRSLLHLHLMPKNIPGEYRPPRHRATSDPLAAALLPPPDESAIDRDERLKRETEAKKVSDSIDDMIRQERSDRKKNRPEVTVLLLGQSESGKSTTLKRELIARTRMCHSVPSFFGGERAIAEPIRPHTARIFDLSARASLVCVLTIVLPHRVPAAAFPNRIFFRTYSMAGGHLSQSIALHQAVSLLSCSFHQHFLRQ